MRAYRTDRRIPEKQDTLRLNICLLLGSVSLLVALFPSAMMGDAISITRNQGGYANTSTLVPVFQNGVDNLPSYTTYCPWVITALTGSNFTPATGWNFAFAGPTQSQFFKSDEATNFYVPLAGIDEVFTDPDGGKHGGEFAPGAFGGAGFEMTYKPGASDPKTDIHWLQVFRLSTNAGTSIKLDNLRAATPWYDTSGAAKMNDPADHDWSWLFDDPIKSVDKQPVNQQFQTFLAVDKFVGGVHNVTLYGGEWWGYTYTAVPLPEPGTLLTLGSGVLGIAGVLRRWC